MIRISLLALFILFLIAYSWKDWYRSLCGLILLMAVIEHPDVPKTIMGIQGMNPWNILFFFIFVAWLFNRDREGLQWDLPNKLANLLVIYLVVIVVAFVRMSSDLSGIISFSSTMEMGRPSFLGLFSEYIINTIKWVLPGVLLFDGCRSRNRFLWAMTAVLGVYFLLALQVIKHMPLGTITSGAGLSKRSLKILSNNVGYHRVNLSMMLSGASWAVFCFRVYITKKIVRKGLLCACAVIVLGQALTGGRTGYATWCLLGVVLCSLRWKKYLMVAPIAVIVVLLAVPAVWERMTQGFSADTHDTSHLVGNTSSGSVDLYTVTAGRTFAWPFVIDKIKEAPFLGYGRMAMQRTGLSLYLWEEYREAFPHPHSAYLQLLLDNGLIGAFPIAIFFYLILKYSFSLFRDKRSVICVTTGGVALSLVLAFLIASLGSQTFYPREGAVGMWCAIFLVFRVYLERAKAKRMAFNQKTPNYETMIWSKG